MATTRGVRPWRRTAWLACLALTASLGLAACEVEADPGPAQPSDAPAEATRLTFGVWGGEEEIAAYEDMVADYNEVSEDTVVVVKPYADRDELTAALQGGDPPPDVFMASRGDLAWMRERELNLPVDELLDERGVDFGDRYSRAALEAFSDDRRLQCMPYSISPLVIFYNADLVDFERMAERGFSVPRADNTRWSFEQFEEAARFATRKRRGTKGVHVDAALRSIAPFVYAGGGQLFDDPEDPTTLALSEEGSRDALERTLGLLRDPTVTLSEKQLARRTPLEWFKRGKLGMMEGFRSLVPELREVPGLEFDVMPIPILEGGATVGDFTGTCIAADTDDVAEAADFLVHATSTEAVGQVTRAGYIVPANQEVALTDDFLQAGRDPEHAGVFTLSVAGMVVPPLLDVWDELDAVVGPLLHEMFMVPVLDDLEALTTRIDEASRPVFAADENAGDAGDAGDAEE